MHAFLSLDEVGSPRPSPLHPGLGRCASKQTRFPNSQYMQKRQIPVPLSLASQSASIVSHIQRVQFDHMLIQLQSSWIWWAPIRSGTLSLWVDTPLVILTSFTFSLFCSSFGPWELSPVLQYGSLSLSPSIARWRFYGDMQDIHQCGYGTRPVQVPSPQLPKRWIWYVLTHKWILVINKCINK